MNNSIYYTHHTDESKNHTAVHALGSTSAFQKTGYTIGSDNLHNFDWNFACSELNDFRPLIIESDGIGHTWVFDGYIDKHEKTTYYEVDYIDYIGNRAIPHYKVSSVIENIQQLVHFNWGWGGECNGYFTIEGSFKTTEGMKYDSNESITHNYNFMKENIYLIGRIHP